MTLNIKIADKMCSKGKIKFCVKELKLEKCLLISFGGLSYQVYILLNNTTTQKSNQLKIFSFKLYISFEFQDCFNCLTLIIWKKSPVIIAIWNNRVKKGWVKQSIPNLSSERSNWNIASDLHQKYGIFKRILQLHFTIH